MALARARDDQCVDEDREVYDYLQGRGLLESWELGVFGVLSAGMAIPPEIAHWVPSGFRVIAPLFNGQGELVNIQARRIVPGRPKTMFPGEARASGTAFASDAGRAVLQGEWNGEPKVLLAEGLTDFVALASCARVPVLSVPGTSFATAALGSWARGCDLFMALDCDEVGEREVNKVAARAAQLGVAQLHRIKWPDRAKDACEVVASRGMVGLAEFLDQLHGQRP